MKHGWMQEGEIEGWMDELMDGWMKEEREGGKEGWMDELKKGRMNESLDGQGEEKMDRGKEEWRSLREEIT